MTLTKSSLVFLFLCLVILFTTVAASPSDQAVIERVMEMYRLDAGTYEIEILSNPLRSATVSPENLAILPLTHKEPLGLFTVMAKVTENGQEVESGQVRMKIRRFADVVIATDKIRSRESLTEDKLTVKRMDVTSLYEQPLESLDDIENYQSGRNLSPGTILTTAAVEPVPDVERGREVSIVYVNGLCHITAAGTALQSGLAGEYIKVKNQTSGKVIVARIVDETAVAVDP